MKTRVWRQYKGSACGGSWLLYRAVARQRLHNCKISAGVGNLANSAKRCAAGEKLRPAGKAGRQPSGDGRHAVSQKRVAPFKRSSSALQECVQNEFRWQIPKRNAVFGSAQARFPTDIAQGTRRGRRGGRRTSRPQKTFCGAEAAFCLRASVSLLLGDQETSRKFPPAAEILQLRGSSRVTAPPSENPLHHSVLRGQNTYGTLSAGRRSNALPRLGAVRPRARPSRRTPRQEAVRSAEIPAFSRFPLFIPSPPARNAQSDEKRS